MKILVFSDTHLSYPFDKKRFNFLVKIINEVDRVIINGDFFDHFMISFDDFVSSPWNQLFPILKAKKTVYIHGNHDNKEFTDKRVNLFCDIEVDRFKLINNGKSYIFEHGHQLRPTPDVRFNIKIMPRYIMTFIHSFHHIMTKMFKKNFLYLRFGFYNSISKKRINRLYKPKPQDIYFIGHNHYGEIDEKNHFVCSGMILYGFAQYLMIDDGKISLHEKWYE